MLRMNKLMKRAAAALLSGLLVLGQAGPALAAQDDSNYGPAFSTKVEQTSPGSLDGQSGDGQGSGPQAVAPANAAPAEQADGAGAAAGSTEAAAGTAGTDGVTSAATILPRPMPRQPPQPSLQQKKQPDRHQPIHLFFRFRCSVRIPHGLTL